MLPVLASRTVSGDPMALGNPPGSKEPIAAPIAAPMAPTTILSGDSSATRLPLVVAATYTAGACAFTTVPRIFLNGVTGRFGPIFQKIFSRVIVERDRDAVIDRLPAHSGLQ